MTTTTTRTNDRKWNVLRAEFWTSCEKLAAQRNDQTNAEYCWLQALSHKNNIDDIDGRQPAIQY